MTAVSLGLNYQGNERITQQTGGQSWLLKPFNLDMGQQANPTRIILTHAQVSGLLVQQIQLVALLIFK